FCGRCCHGRRSTGTTSRGTTWAGTTSCGTTSRGTTWPGTISPGTARSGTTWPGTTWRGIVSRWTDQPVGRWYTAASMITRFGSLFAGHVDLDGHGFEAPAVNDRWLSNDRLLTVFDKATRIAQLMDRRGYDVFWLAEHHFQREGYEVIPNIERR